MQRAECRISTHPGAVFTLVLLVSLSYACFIVSLEIKWKKPSWGKTKKILKDNLGNWVTETAGSWDEVQADLRKQSRTDLLALLGAWNKTPTGGSASAWSPMFMWTHVQIEKR